MIRVKRGTENKKTKRPDIVVIDHGLYCHEPEAFRESYARLWNAIIVGDTEGVKKVAEGWGIHDHELFASFQLFRPYKGAATRSPVATAGVVSRKEILELQMSVKERVVKMLSDTSLVPPELSLVGRHLNLIRSLNKALDSPVNRPRIMAMYANRGVHKNTSYWISDARFQLSLFGIELLYQLTEFWRKLKKSVTGNDAGGFEDILERQFTKNVEDQLGFKISTSIPKTLNVG